MLFPNKELCRYNVNGTCCETDSHQVTLTQYLCNSNLDLSIYLSIYLSYCKMTLKNEYKDKFKGHFKDEFKNKFKNKFKNTNCFMISQ